MTLPVLNTPNYEMEVPSTGEKVEYRPFLVKEQKVLMIAQESEDQNQIVKAIMNIVRTCTFGKVDRPESLPTFDLEYIVSEFYVLPFLPRARDAKSLKSKLHPSE